ncbi:hypothetical protein NSTC745_01675 [Nostoc sp. DSM 114161]
MQRVTPISSQFQYNELGRNGRYGAGYWLLGTGEEIVLQ